jgi:hypothetical protein
LGTIVESVALRACSARSSPIVHRRRGQIRAVQLASDVLRRAIGRGAASVRPRGPDAEEYGASRGYPIGDRAICLRGSENLAFFVGCHSHFDQVIDRAAQMQRTALP